MGDRSKKEGSGLETLVKFGIVALGGILLGYLASKNAEKETSEAREEVKFEQQSSGNGASDNPYFKERDNLKGQPGSK